MDGFIRQLLILHTLSLSGALLLVNLFQIIQITTTFLASSHVSSVLAVFTPPKSKLKLVRYTLSPVLHDKKRLFVHTVE